MRETSWTEIEKLARAYLRKPGVPTALALDRCLKRASVFASHLGEYFVRNHEGLSASGVEFCHSEGGSFPEWGCRYSERSGQFAINPVGVILFTQECESLSAQMQPEDGKAAGEWPLYRLNSFKAELHKLPSQLHLFLLLFQEMARVLGVTQIDYKKSAVRQERCRQDMDYLNFLWAFRELEKAYAYLFGGDLRVNTQFTWWESKWSEMK